MNHTYDRPFPKVKIVYLKGSVTRTFLLLKNQVRIERIGTIIFINRKYDEDRFLNEKEADHIVRIFSSQTVLMINSTHSLNIAYEPC